MRTSGILMPVFSLPEKHGIGTFGRQAYRFVDFLAKAGQTYWQILPFGPTGAGDSPYQSFSSFAGNPYFIDLDLLCEEGLLTDDEIRSFDFGRDPQLCDYGKLYENRPKLLALAFERFRQAEPGDFSEFCDREAVWLKPYTLFMALKQANGGKSWDTWDAPYRFRDPAAIADAEKSLADVIRYHAFLQYQFSGQWKKLKNYANRLGIRIIGDLPIYVSYDSAEVWAEPEQFQLDDGKKPVKVAGVPPDAFSEDGQLWGNPLYDWSFMKKDGYAWWKRRLCYTLRLFDSVRIDHFRGFEAYYAIPAGDENARRGRWEKGPGIGFFREMKKEFGALPVIAEDLGFLTPGVRRMLRESGFPGMKVLQFAFDSREESDYLPYHYPVNCVVYTGTHDNDTILGWTKSAPAEDVEFARRFLHVDPAEGFNWAMIRAALSSVADTAILTMQDLIGLSGEGRINVPSTVGGNWRWRVDASCVNDWLAEIVRENTALYGRVRSAECGQD